MARQVAEPVAWILFSAGGVLAALFLPALGLLFGLAFPLGLVAAPDHAGVASIIAHPVTRLTLLALISLSLLHWAHRFRYTLYDGLQIKHLNEVINTLCYGGAIAGSLWAAWLLLTFG